MQGSPHDSAAIDIDNNGDKWDRNAWIAAIDDRAGTHSPSISKTNMVDGIIRTAGRACDPPTKERRTALRTPAADKMMVAVAVNHNIGYGGNGFCEHIVHKFQGRECDEIVFSTVLDKKRYNQMRKRLDFVDEPRMINVAVSRAKHRFTLVTGDEVFTDNNGHIAALIRYISYYAQGEQIVRAPVVSAFDLLYREYDQSLARLDARLRAEDSRYKSEQIIAQLLREALSAPAYQALKYHTQIQLDQLASPGNLDWTERQRAFMRRASCDFVIYFKVGKKPIGVIEVDGGYHDQPVQAARDAMKNEILAKSGIPILRLRTVESDIERRIGDFIGQWAGPTQSA